MEIDLDIIVCMIKVKKINEGQAINKRLRKLRLKNTHDKMGQIRKESWSVNDFIHSVNMDKTTGNGVKES